ncbi:hypothetical protein [Roseinatronobacter alkalisoli]|uniref:Uncharacterized protein n=1 Tax=Roseinatronobacter alkalisoli TaxID=3028235 RepID=A0ABT5T4S0_9RHOB|nr:hypothetical protein [Roseinatronobacter sp. HJB301]MDD7970110.1 hypothetical protein [Roseinatronobacter sp. HJB301]
MALPLDAQTLQGGRPLNAIDWLEDAMSQPDTTIGGMSLPLVTPQDTPEAIAVSPLGAPALDQVGLFVPQRVGLPRDLWGGAPVPEVLAGISALPVDTLPAALQLGYRLLLAEFDPPAQLQPETQGTVLVARIDKLMAMGALEQASQLIDAAPVRTAALNTRAFDIALLLGEEDSACTSMSGQITTDFGHGAKIFCLARRGDWQAAYTTLNATTSLGLLEASEASLLQRFLEEEDAHVTPPPPAELSPLGWRILEALGDPVPTASLPVAYAYADLRGTSGWRAQLDAAERLTRAGVMQPNRLLGLYAQRRPAASGGVWERVRAVQTLDHALASGDSAGLSRALNDAWPKFASVELEVAFAQMFAETLAESGTDPATLDASARTILWHVLMLTQTRLDLAGQIAPQSDKARLATALAMNDASLPDIESSSMAAAVAQAFASSPETDMSTAPVASAGGLLLLDALNHIAHAAVGDPREARLGLQSLRLLGLDDATRQIAIELLLLERRG